MTTMTTTTPRPRIATPTTRRTDGMLLWRATGGTLGNHPHYAPRREGETEPSAWVIWSPRMRDVDALDRVVTAGAQRAL